jgi:acyl-CoA thioester hydrolase
MNTNPHPLEAHGYKSIISLPIQWGDMDAFGHVNNTIPIRWFESSRIAYMDHTGSDALMQAAGLGPILASIRCDYLRQMHYPDTVWIGAKITRLGNSSLNMVHAVFSEHQQAVTAEADSTIVVFDYQANKPRRIPDQVRQALTQYERELEE